MRASGPLSSILGNRAPRTPPPAHHGEPADPPAYLTAIPSWRAGDTFLAGSELRRFRIVAMDEAPSDDFHGLMTVEAVDD